jgi:hypothetical protein
MGREWRPTAGGRDKDAKGSDINFLPNQRIVEGIIGRCQTDVNIFLFIFPK